MRRSFAIGAAATAAALAAGLATGPGTASAASATTGATRSTATTPAPTTSTSGPLPTSGAAAGFLASLPGVGADPAASPAGVNVAGCRPSSAHPYPVVLVNGTFEVMQDSFDYLGPRLAASGYCVFGFNYGANAPQDRVQAVGPVAVSVQQLAAEVTRVTAETHTAKVDLVGYSQGGLLSELYTKFGGATHVRSVTALAPTTHGTTLLGVAALGRAIPGALPALRAGGCPACADQVVGSATLRRLDSGPIAVPGVRYTVIDTRFEDAVTPTGSSFIREPGVVDEYVQDFDPLDLDEHVVLPFDPVTGDRVLAALGRADR